MFSQTQHSIFSLWYKLSKIFFLNTNTPYTCKQPWWSYLPNPSARAGYDTRSIFKRSLTGLNSEFSFSYSSCLNKAEEPSLSYYLPIAGGGIIGFIPFPRVLVLCEMQSFSSRIWTRVAGSNSYDDNHYTTGTSKQPWWWPMKGPKALGRILRNSSTNSNLKLRHLSENLKGS